jgi:hypothetical protein
MSASLRPNGLIQRELASMYLMQVLARVSASKRGLGVVQVWRYLQLPGGRLQSSNNQAMDANGVRVLHQKGECRSKL